jgi:hypothetical protein
MDGTSLGKLTLPSGGTVEFIDLDDLTGADLREIRATIATEDSAGATTNKLLDKAIALVVKTWDVPYLADPRTPQANPAACRKLKARDLAALERHVQPVLDLMKPPTENAAALDDTPGSPTPPGSE